MFTEYSKDLATYLQFCKDVVFAGVKPSLENHEEEKIIESLWDYYEKEVIISRFNWKGYPPRLFVLILWLYYFIKKEKSRREEI